MKEDKENNELDNRRTKLGYVVLFCLFCVSVGFLLVLFMSFKKKKVTTIEKISSNISTTSEKIYSSIGETFSSIIENFSKFSGRVKNLLVDILLSPFYLVSVIFFAPYYLAYFLFHLWAKAP